MRSPVGRPAVGSSRGASQAGLADARLLAAIAQMVDVVARAEGSEPAAVMNVHLTGVPGHGFAQAEERSARAGAQESLYQSQYRAQFGVVPGQPPMSYLY